MCGWIYCLHARHSHDRFESKICFASCIVHALNLIETTDNTYGTASTSYSQSDIPSTNLPSPKRSALAYPFCGSPLPFVFCFYTLLNSVCGKHDRTRSVVHCVYERMRIESSFWNDVTGMERQHQHTLTRTNRPIINADCKLLSFHSLTNIRFIDVCACVSYIFTNEKEWRMLNWTISCLSI